MWTYTGVYIAPHLWTNMEANTDMNRHITLNEKEGLWIDTPHGMIRIHVGFGGIHRITSWLPHIIDVKKKTLRGEMQVTMLQPEFDSVCAHNRGE